MYVSKHEKMFWYMILSRMRLFTTLGKTYLGIADMSTDMEAKALIPLVRYSTGRVSTGKFPLPKGLQSTQYLLTLMAFDSPVWSTFQKVETAAKGKTTEEQQK